MSHQMGSYDENLLRDAPVATKQQLQEGYTTDLLAPPSKPRSLNRTQSPLPDGATIPPTALLADLEHGHQDGFNHYAPLSEKVIPSSNRTPFFRTTKGIILIAVIVIIIVGAVVGAAVGTTVNKSQSPTNSTIVSGTVSSTLTPTSTISSPGSGVNGNGQGGSNSADVGGGSPTPSVQPQSPKTTRGSNNGDILQSESNAIAAMKQSGGHYKRWDASQASTT